MLYDELKEIRQAFFDHSEAKILFNTFAVRNIYVDNGDLKAAIASGAALFEQGNQFIAIMAPILNALMSRSGVKGDMKLLKGYFEGYKVIMQKIKDSLGHEYEHLHQVLVDAESAK